MVTGDGRTAIGSRVFWGRGHFEEQAFPDIPRRRGDYSSKLMKNFRLFFFP